MIYHLLYPFQESISSLRVFRYISFRLFLCVLTSLLISLLLGPPVIRWLRKIQGAASGVREDVPEGHKVKVGTPSMGGILIVFSILISVILWSRWDNASVWMASIAVLLFSLIGLNDDYAKLTRKKGISSLRKLSYQLICASVIAGFLVYSGFDRSLQLPFFKNLSPTLSPLLYFIFAVVVIVGSSNAVNLTDGLDGLAIGPVLICAFTFLILAYLAGHDYLASYLHIISLKEAGELTVFCGAILGAGLGFLWFNAYPAQVFMGDVGSLSLGAALGTISLLVKQEFLLAVAGGIFVIETISVILQVFSFKTTGKRIFKMAPIHHHFELKGIAEPKVIVRFWIVSIVLGILALVSLKLR